jgi:hypothetical protein
VGRGFILRSTLPAVHQPHQIKMPVQNILSSKKSGNNPRLYPIEEKNLTLGPQHGPEITPEPVVGYYRGPAKASGAGSPASD